MKKRIIAVALVLGMLFGSTLSVSAATPFLNSPKPKLQQLKAAPTDGEAILIKEFPEPKSEEAIFNNRYLPIFCGLKDYPTSNLFKGI